MINTEKTKNNICRDRSLPVRFIKEKLKNQKFSCFFKKRRIESVNINQLSTGSQGVALIGEAAGFISPSSAEGLSYAFKTALLLSETLVSNQLKFEKQYRNKTRKLAVNILFKNLKSNIIFNPLLRKIIMKSGFNSLDVIEQ